MEAALRRELMEELAIDVTDIKPLFFNDGTYNKLFANGDQRDVYMIFLIFSCRAKSTDITLSAEFSEYAWIRKDDLNSYDLNSASIITFQRAGVL
jgi:nucleoside triphosphatase